MDIATRFAQNPILAPKDIKASESSMVIECLLNPGVFRYQSKIGLVVRVAECPQQSVHSTTVPIYSENGTLEFLTIENDDPKFDNSDKRVFQYNGKHYLSTLSHLRLFFSSDGLHFQESEDFPAIYPKGEQEAFGIEDCRVSQIGDIYFLTYTKVSSNGVGVGLMSTTDWKSFDRKGMIFPAHNKDCALFDEQIDGKYFALHRPSSPELGGNYIWIAESPDLEHWGHHKCIATTRDGYWDSARIGAGAAPIKTDRGWLEIYHGADENHRYCLGALLLNLKDPTQVIARSDQPIMEPQADYEKTGFFGNVVFTNGQIVVDDEITIYYGASDEVICGARFSINQILTTLNP